MNMETHVKALGALQIALSALGLVSAVTLAIVFGGAMGIIHATADQDVEAALPIIGLAGGALIVFLIALSIPCLVIGVGLLQRRPWARTAGIVISILGMVFFPFGTVVGVYGLWVLFSKETEQLFAGPTRA
jgi:hypothetical protein